MCDDEFGVFPADAARRHGDRHRQHGPPPLPRARAAPTGALAAAGRGRAAARLRHAAAPVRDFARAASGGGLGEVEQRS